MCVFYVKISVVLSQGSCHTTAFFFAAASVASTIQKGGGEKKMLSPPGPGPSVFGNCLHKRLLGPGAQRAGEIRRH